MRRLDRLSMRRVAVVVGAALRDRRFLHGGVGQRTSDMAHRVGATTTSWLMRSSANAAASVRQRAGPAAVSHGCDPI